MECTYFTYLWHGEPALILVYYHVFKREFAARESVSFELFKSSALAMPGRGKRANSTAKAIIYNVYKYFEKECAKNKCKRPPKLTSKTAEATGYSERRARFNVSCERSISLLIGNLLYNIIHNMVILCRYLYC